MPEPATPLPEVHVQPGEIHLIRQPAILRTVLGSCVGITFWAPQIGVSVLCHPVLPRHPVNLPAAMTRGNSRRYVDFAIVEIARHLDSLGTRRSAVHVKLFGGCDVLPALHKPERPTVGKLNCEAALQVLEVEGFRVSASCLGERCGLTILFNTETGDVLVKRLY